MSWQEHMTLILTIEIFYGNLPHPYFGYQIPVLNEIIKIAWNSPLQS